MTITIKVTSLDDIFKKALILQELAQMIDECDIKELNRPSQQWGGEYCNVTIETAE